MRASWLGKVSHNKWRQAMNPSSLIAVVAIDAVLIERRQSAGDTNASNATRNEVMAKNSALKLQGSLADKHNKSVVRASWVTRQNSSRNEDYRCRCVNRRKTSAANAAMKPGDPLNGENKADRANSCPWSHTTRASGSTKKAKQAAKTSAAAMTRGTRITRTTLAAQTAWASWLTVPRTPSPTKQSKREGQQQQIPSWWVTHTQNTNVGYDVLSCFCSRTRAVPQNVRRKIRTLILIGMLRSKTLSCQFWVAHDADLKNRSSWKNPC